MGHLGVSGDLLGQRRPAGRRLEGVAEVLHLVADAAVGELHDAHREGRDAVVGDGALADPEIPAAADPADREVPVGRMAAALGADGVPPAEALTGLRIVQDGVVGVDGVLGLAVAPFGGVPVFGHPRPRRAVVVHRNALPIGRARHPGAAEATPGTSAALASEDCSTPAGDSRPTPCPGSPLPRRPTMQSATVMSQPGIAEGSVGRLMSVNVGLPQDLAWQGRTVRTAVWKRPVEGSRVVRRLNIDGDGQGDLAGHGGPNRAVFVYQLESYEYWQHQLGRSDFTHGEFGENFTVTGLADDQVCIGDRFRIGDALFEVSQPRVTCYRVGIRMDDVRIPALLVSHHRPGFYLRVLREGVVQAGDEIVRVAAGVGAMTVATVDGLLYLPGHPREQVREALRIPALSEGWKTSFRAIADQDADAGAAGNAGLSAVSPPAAWPGFRPLTVTGVEPESESVISVHLADPGGVALPAALPGQFLTLRLDAVPGAPPLLRSYSLSGPPEAGPYRISVKRESRGVGSAFVHERVRPGDQLEVAAPRGTFVLRPGETPVVLISAGVGATPVLAMLHALAAGGSTRNVWWLHGARCRAEEPFVEESRSLMDRLARGHRHVCYSRPGPGDVRGRDYQTTGRLSAAVL